MGNKLCKKKDNVDNSVGAEKEKASSFDRIFTRLRLKPNSWKSEPHLNNEKSPKSKLTKCEVSSKSPSDQVDNIVKSQPLSKSTDWTNCDLNVPDETIHLPNPKLSLIFNNNDIKGTPTPPPRKHKKTVKEKLEAVAKSSLQAFKKQSHAINQQNGSHTSEQHSSDQKTNDNKVIVSETNESNAIAVEEPIFVKKTINYKCPICDSDEASHNRDHHHHHNTVNKRNDQKQLSKSNKNKKSVEDQVDNKRRKNLSVVSLPNYTDLKFTVAENTDTIIDKQKQNTDKKLATAGSTGKLDKLDNYITRCRSFGSIFPNQKSKDKLKTHSNSAEVESDEDDSFGGFEDWDGLGIIEHYNPKDTSLPRPRKTQKDVISDLESLIVQEEDIPKPPVRRSESLIKKLNRKSEMSTNQSINRKSVTPPPSPEKIEESKECNNETVTMTGDHSSLMKILQEFCLKDSKINNNMLILDNETMPEVPEVAAFDEKTNDLNNESNHCLQKNVESIKSFIDAEKNKTNLDLTNNKLFK